MREKKFTPGPWNVEKENIHIGSIATCHGDEGPWYEVWTANWAARGIDQKANAHLIAVSPLMLEALENIQIQIQQVNDGDRPYTGFDTELIDAVISSAYGETP